MKLARGHALVALAATSWGTWSLFLRRAEARGPIAAETETFLVMATLAVVLTPIALLDLRRTPLGRRELAWLAVLGVTDALSLMLFFAAMRATTIPVAVLTHCTAPVLVALAAPLFGSERLRARTLGGASLAVVGLTLLLSPWSASSVPVRGALLGGASAVFYASTVLLQKHVASRVTPTQSLGLHAVVSAIVLAVAVPSGGFRLTGDQVALVVGGAMILSVGGGMLFVRALTTIPASHAAVLALLEPVVAVLVSVLWWGERLGPSGLVGAAIVLAGLWAVVSSDASEAREPA